jgi:hypothetical protein
MTKREYNHDKAKAAPVDFDEHPPEDYVDDPEDEIVLDAKAAMTCSEAAQRAGSILGRLDKNDIDALYSALNPLVAKLRWYRSRYNAMQDKIWYLDDDNKRLLKKNKKLEQRLTDLGHDPNK